MNTIFIIVLSTNLAACVTDLRRQRIPNLLTFGSALAALLFHAVTGGASGALSASAGWLVGAAVFFLPFALGGMGAGDVKLVAALGAWLGPGDTLWLTLYAGIAGGVLAIVVAFARGYLRQALANVWLLLAHWRVMGLRPLNEVTLAGSAGPRLAYAVPILAGTLATIWLH
jgi:prepilin peptidase CpaA